MRVSELLLEHDADVDHADASGRSPLQAAVSMGHAALVRLLLLWGCAVDMIDVDGRTVLCLACQQGSMLRRQSIGAVGGVVLHDVPRDHGAQPFAYVAFIQTRLRCKPSNFPWPTADPFPGASEIRPSQTKPPQ